MVGIPEENLSQIDELIIHLLNEKSVELIDGEILPPEMWDDEPSISFDEYKSEVTLINFRNNYGETYKVPQNVISKYKKAYEEITK